MPELTKEMVECIDNCLEAFKIGNYTIRHCLEMGEEHANPKHIETLQSGSYIAGVAAGAMARMSDLHKDVCGVCAKACEEVVKSCKQYEGEEMKRCADVFRKSAESCKKMAEK